MSAPSYFAARWFRRIKKSGDKSPHSKMRETKAQRKARTEQIIKLLKRAHPDAHCALNHSNAFELLIATILSAQCTDERVNIVTADLFRKYRGPTDYLKVPATELQQDIHTTGFFRNKTKSIQGACKMLTEEFGGQVPQTMEELLKLPGVARKTGNVVLGVAFGIAAGIVVDTHVSRLSQRLRARSGSSAAILSNRALMKADTFGFCRASGGRTV